MKLSDIFDALTYGELSSLAIGGADTGKIDPKDYAKLVSHINLGLTDLYTRFHLKEGQVTLALQASQLAYELDVRYAVTCKSSREPVRYLLDSASNPFPGDLLKVTRVLTAGGHALGLNNLADSLGVTTPTLAQLMVPAAIVNQDPNLADCYKTATLDIRYRASHVPVRLPVGTVNPAAIEIKLPTAYLQALLLFVGARLHVPLGANAQGQSPSNDLMTRYELACKLLGDTGIEVDQAGSHSRFEQGGWV
jgi:hypothetical protein